MATNKGLLSVQDLESKVASGDIDTVIISFTDIQGRLVGKRMSARLFVEDAMEHGAECCNYLLAVDVDMNTVDGYRMSSWESGYGDMVMTPDFRTLRRIPWLPGTALVMADLSFTDGRPVLPAPRNILRGQLDRLADDHAHARLIGEALLWAHRAGLPVEDAAAGYRAMDERRATKVLLTL